MASVKGLTDGKNLEELMIIRLKKEIVKALMKARRISKILDPQKEFDKFFYTRGLNEVLDNLEVLIVSLLHDNESTSRELEICEEEVEELTLENENLREEIRKLKENY